MKKLSIVAGIVAVATVGLVGRVQAQAFYPGTTTTGVPGRVSGTYGGYPSQYPSTSGQYPQYPSTAHQRGDDDRRDGKHERKHERREDSYRDRDGDRDDQRSSYGSRSSGSVPSRVRGYSTDARSAARDQHWKNAVRGHRSNDR